MECKKNKFKPRYDYIFPEWFSRISSIKGNSEQLKVLKEKIYIYDICIRCGKIIKRE